MKLKDDIKRTVDYAKKYNCELSCEEIKERLISNKVYGDEEIEQILCPSQTPVTSFDKETLKKIKKAKGLVRLLEKNFKDILMVGITGSVAAGHPKKNDDIDLMVIVKKNTLWLTRLRLRYFIYKQQIPHRKYGLKENRNEFCFNLWLDEDKLLLPKNRQNLKNAVDLILMKPIFNREDAYEKFIISNSWAKKWVATGYSKIRKHFSICSTSFNGNTFCLKTINFLIFIPQFLFMKRKIKNERVSLKQAFFHPDD